MTQKKKKPTPASRDRVVYEVRTGNTPRQVEATSTAELRAYPESLGASGAIFLQMMRQATSWTNPM